MNNPIMITFTDGTKAVYHIAIGCPIQNAIAEIEEETEKTVEKFEWMHAR